MGGPGVILSRETLRRGNFRYIKYYLVINRFNEFEVNTFFKQK